MSSSSTPAGPSPSGPSTSNPHPAAPRPSTGPSMSCAPSARHNQTPQRNRRPGNNRSNNPQRSNHRRGPPRTTSYSLADEPDDIESMLEVRQLIGGSRRGNIDITHMLDFATTPIHYPAPLYGNGSYSGSSWRRTPHHTAYRHQTADKALYVNANYRFVLSPSTRYPAVASTADARVSWPDVLQVLASPISQAARCPMCLSEPTAPRITRCGHIYCLACVLQFLATPLDDSSRNPTAPPPRPDSKKCPICEDVIVRTDLRPVRFYAAQETAVPKPGEDVILRLMARSSTSTLALPHSGGSGTGEPAPIDRGLDAPWHFETNVLDYARVMKGTVAYMEQQYDEEVCALNEMVAADLAEYGQVNDWAHRAISSIAEARKKVGSILETPSEETPSVAGASPRKKAETPAVETTPPTDFFFYAAPPHLYLSPLDIRILKTHFGSFSAFPSTLLPRVTALSTGHPISDPLRRRARYLSHLPTGCTVSFLECDWSSILPATSLAPFAAELAARCKRHAAKDAAEDREKERAEKRLNAEMRRTAGIMVDGAAHGSWVGGVHEIEGEEFWGEEEFPAFSAAAVPEKADYSGGGDLGEFSVAGGETQVETMTRTTVWGTRVAEPTGEMLYGGTSTNHGGDGNDGWLPDEILEDQELARQLAELETGEDRGGSKGKGKGKAGGGKKKKTKITLMSTGGKRGL